MNFVRSYVNQSLRYLGYEIRKVRSPLDPQNLPPDLEPEFLSIYKKCHEYTMTSVERMYALWKSINYIAANNIEGDFVECGVWRGGSSMLMAHQLIQLNNKDKSIFLFDTFEGMAEPTDQDVSQFGGKAREKFDALKAGDHNDWAYASIEEVRANLLKTGFPADRIKLIKGKVEDTLSESVCGKISMLRLDTDWYESTKKELQVLYPKLSKNGVLIIDDYGHWLGARKATDEYFSNGGYSPYLHRIDYTGRLLIKI